MVSMFTPATRKKSKLRMAIDGPSGSGKTYTALRMAFALGKKVVAIDTEHASMSKYQGDAPDGIPWNWQACELQHFDPQNYTTAITEARKLRPDVLIIDSLSHAWEGKGGALEQVERSKSKNKYTAWKEVTPKHRAMVEAILAFPGHVIVTMRSKMEHVLEENEKGRMIPRKVGMAPIQRPGTEYEFDIVGELDWDHTLQVTKTRCSAIDGLRVEKPGPEFMEPVKVWLEDGSIVTKPGAGSETERPSHQGTAPTPPSAILTTPDKAGVAREIVAATNVPPVIQPVMDQVADILAKPPTMTGIVPSRDELPIGEFRKRIITMASRLGMKAGDLLPMINIYGVAKIAELSNEQASDLLWKLGQMWSQRSDGKEPQKGNNIPF